jgi:hypothetical protein
VVELAPVLGSSYRELRLNELRLVTIHLPAATVASAN